MELENVIVIEISKFLQLYNDIIFKVNKHIFPEIHKIDIKRQHYLVTLRNRALVILILLFYNLYNYFQLQYSLSS